MRTRYSLTMRLTLIAICLILASVCHAQFTAAPGGPFAAGAYPSSIAVADFNNDGLQDVAVTDLSSNAITVMLGTANGGFRPPQHYGVGTNPVSIVVFYLPSGVAGCSTAVVSCASLAVANEGSGIQANGTPANGTVSVLLGNGQGGFTTPATSVVVGSAPVSVAAGNLNGSPILLAANFGDNTVTVIAPVMTPATSSGASPVFTGGFSACASAFSVGSHPSSVAVGDFNGDGIPDFAVANKSDATVTVYLGTATPCSYTLNPQGPFPVTVLNPPAPPLAYPASIVTADFNLDGYLDLAIADEGINAVSILLGDGNGNFGPTAYMPAIPLISTGNAPFALAVGYFNDNMYPDLAVTNLMDSTVSVLTGSGTGTFTPVATAFPVGLLPDAVGVGDFNNDGKPDIAVANRNSNSISVLLNGNAGVSTVSAARLIAPVSPGSLVFINGSGLATAGQAPTSGAPIVLGGASVVLTDSTGLQTPLYLLSTSPTQIEAYIPATVNAPTYSPVNPPPSFLTVYTSSSSSMTMQTGAVPLKTLAPALFSANGTGEGVALGTISQSSAAATPGTSIATCPDGTFSCVPNAIDLSKGGTLTLQGTGILSASDISSLTSGTGLTAYSSPVTVDLGRAGPITCAPVVPTPIKLPTCTVSAPTAQGPYPWQSTITLQLPAESITGLVKITVTSGSLTSNIVTVFVQP